MDDDELGGEHVSGSGAGGGSRRATGSGLTDELLRRW
jgi:hypothetical protein